MEREREERRRRVEFRAGVAISATAAMVAIEVTAAVASIVAGVATRDGAPWVTAWLGTSSFIGACAATGWWVDALRADMGGAPLPLRQRSVVGWTVPLMNLFRPRRDVHWLLDGARGGDGATTWCVLWVGALITQVWGPGLVLVLVRTALALTPAALILWLVPTVMAGARGEWRRQDELAEVTGSPSID